MSTHTANSKSNNKSSKAAAAADNSKKQFLANLEQEAQKIPPARLKPMVEARNLAPQLFKNECDPFMFCCRDDGDDAAAAAKATAQRLVDYWHHRNALFGDRKYLPLDQTGKGALTQQDVALLQTGFVAPLFSPSRQQQQQGNNSDNDTVVLCFNRSRLLLSNDKRNDNKQQQQYFSAQSKLRCIFYVLYLLCRQQHLQQQQAAATTTTTRPNSNNKNACRIRVLMPNAQSNLSHAILRFAACFPIRIESIHLVCTTTAAAAGVGGEPSLHVPELSSSSGGTCTSSSSMHELFPAFVVQQQEQKPKSIGTKQSTAARIKDDNNDDKPSKAPILHLAANPADAVAQLQSHGFTRDVIPQELGGDWSYKDQFEAWLMEHRQREVAKMLNDIAAESLDALGDLAAQEMMASE